MQHLFVLLCCFVNEVLSRHNIVPIYFRCWLLKADCGRLQNMKTGVPYLKFGNWLESNHSQSCYKCVIIQCLLKKNTLSYMKSFDETNPPGIFSTWVFFDPPWHLRSKMRDQAARPSRRRCLTLSDTFFVSRGSCVLNGLRCQKNKRWTKYRRWLKLNEVDAQKKWHLDKLGLGSSSAECIQDMSLRSCLKMTWTGKRSLAKGEVFKFISSRDDGFLRGTQSADNVMNLKEICGRSHQQN